MAKVIYCRNNGIGSYLIRLQAWFGKWSHAGLLTEQGTVIQATAWYGVVETRLEDFKAEQSAWHIEEVPCPDDAAAIRFARKQLGKRYDWTAVLGFLFSRNWQEDDCWECTELVEASLLAGGRDRFRAVNRVTPMMSYYTK